jgi:stage 0 sporulation protein B (sporulation initiation phosphotransferase)
LWIISESPGYFSKKSLFLLPLSNIIRIKMLTQGYFFDILTENSFRTINVGVRGMKDWNIVEVLRHSRHDWLNRLQLIKGNMDLNRIDRAKAIIDEIVLDTQQEAKLSNLQMPMFAALLLKSNWENYFFQLEYEVLTDSDSLKIDDSILTNWSNSLFLSLNSAIEPFGENHLSITIDVKTDGICFFFDFSGIIRKTEQMKQFLIVQKGESINLVVKEFSENEFALEVFMPFL